MHFCHFGNESDEILFNLLINCKFTNSILDRKVLNKMQTLFQDQELMTYMNGLYRIEILVSIFLLLM
mgnify:CR=1 FL=1